METKTIEVCDAIHISVSCEYNDSADIKCGGPAVLGYDFIISPDENIKDVEEKIKGWIYKYKRGFIGISHYTHKDFPTKKLWTLEKIEECIKKYAL